MQPPFEFVPFTEMTPKQAQEHFDWFINEIPSRIEMLIGAIKDTGTNSNEIDFTVESLKPLWVWFKERITTVPRSSEEIDRIKNSVPEWIRDDVQDWDLSKETLTLAIDIAIYLSEVFIRNNPSLHWGLLKKPKSDISFNRPVVFGFRNSELEPTRVIVNLCSSYVEGKPNKDLLSLFEVWSKFIK